jgi:hypothetical protein
VGASLFSRRLWFDFLREVSGNARVSRGSNAGDHPQR